MEIDRKTKLNVYFVREGARARTEAFKEYINSDAFFKYAIENRWCIDDFKELDFIPIGNDEEYEQFLADKNVSGLFLFNDELYDYVDEKANDMLNRFTDKIVNIINNRRGYVILCNSRDVDRMGMWYEQISKNINPLCSDYFHNYGISLQFFSEPRNYKFVFKTVIAPVIINLLGGLPILEVTDNIKRVKTKNSK